MKTAFTFAVYFISGIFFTLRAQPLAPAATVQSAGVVLDKGWQSLLSGNTVSMKELASLLSPFFQPNADTSSTPSIEIYQGVTYLMPWKTALQKLGIGQNLPSKVKVMCPGFPKDSFYDFLFTGNFDGDYDQLHLITDSAGQVVSIELVCTKPKKRATEHWKEEPWHTIDFVGNKTKAVSTVWVFHDVQFKKPSYTTWSTYNAMRDDHKTVPDIVRIETEALAMKGGSTSVYEARINETSRWYVPRPLGELILFCVRKNG